jgi:N-methylhydantoinase B
MLFERHALREDSGGAGRYRGGLGTEQVVQARAPININIQVDRVHCPPWGLAGGHAGAGNQVALRIAGKEIADLPNAKVLMKRLGRGDAITIRAGGGGGFGPPEERDPEAVAHDVRQGYVSLEVARDTYAVVLDPRKFTVDVAATAKRRTELKGK